ncbi:MAG: restriction endonuclease subunit S [bacterium]
MKWKEYRKYKPSGIEWLGEIPTHWEVKRLKYLSSINDETLPENSDPDLEISYVDIGSVDAVKGIVETEELNFENAPSRARRIVRAGDVIVSTVRTYLRAIAPIVDPKPGLIVSTGFAVVRPRAQFAGQFAAYALRAPYFVDRVVANSVGVSYPAINASDMARLPLCTPELSEQRTIATFLDRETGRIDALIAKKERQIELLQEKRTALISHAVTKGLDPNVKMKDSGIEWLGEIPAHWEVPPLYARYNVQLGKMLDTKRITGEYLLPYLRNIDVQWNRVNVRELPEMDIHPEEYDRYTLRKGDLLVCEGGEIGRTAIWRDELEICAFQKAIHRVRPRTDHDLPPFFFYVMCTAVGSGTFVAGGNPNTILHLTAEKLRIYRFAFPPLQEQYAIVAFLDRETGQIDGLIGKIHSSIEKLREYRTALISAAVTGKIDVSGEVL